MTTEQLLIIAILVTAMAAFASARLRTEVVAIGALALAVLVGLVDFDGVFTGLANPAVITVVEILILAQLLQHSGLVDRLAAPVLSRLASQRQLIVFVTVTGAGLSVFMNNIGALAIMLPLAYAGCRRLAIAPRAVLMPLSFATLLGGMGSLIGTPANLVVSGARADSLGAPMEFFTFALVGVPAMIAGLAWLALSSGKGRGISDAAAPAGGGPGTAERVVFERQLAPASSWAGQGIGDVERLHDLEILHVLRDDRFVFARRDDIRLAAGDRLVLSASPRVFEHSGHSDAFVMSRGRTPAIREAVVTPGSVILGSTIGSAVSFVANNVEIVGVRGSHVRADGRLGDIRISVGDVLLLAGDEGSVAEAIDEAGCLPLAARQPDASERMTPFAALALGGGILLAATQLAPPEIAFGAALALLALTGGASIPDLLRRIDWRVILMLAALIPLAQAFETSGAAAAMAGPMLDMASGHGVLIVCSIWLLTVLITPFLNNVATAAVMAPIALAAADAAGLPPDMLLLAVAAGASTDFLTPFGHHNNTVVMGAAGYELKDFLYRGAPLTVITGIVTLTALFLFF